MKNENYQILKAQTIDEIHQIIREFDKVFEPALSARITDINVYTEKLYKNAIVYMAKGNDILGFIAFYANDNRTCLAYISEIAVKPEAQGKKIGKALLEKCIEISRKTRMRAVKMEVDNSNIVSINFYKKNGFEYSGEASRGSMYMKLIL